MDKRMVEQLNFRVLSKVVPNLQKILHTISYAVLACYDSTTQMWTYLKFKGPLFLVQDKLKYKKIIILNQCSTNNFIHTVHESYKFELKNMGNSGYMINYGVQDTIAGWIIKGIWTQDEDIKEFYKQIVDKQN